MNTERFHYSPTALRTGYNAMLIGLGAVVIGGLAASFGLRAAASDQGLWQALAYDSDGELNLQLLMLPPLLLLTLAGVILVRMGRIELDDHGIRISMPRLSGAGLVGIATGDHWVPWEQIRGIHTEVPDAGQLSHALGRARLLIETEGGTLKVSPFNYVRKGGPDHRLSTRDMLKKPEKGYARTLVDSAPLVTSLRERGYLKEAPPEGGEAVETVPGSRQYDLLHHKGMIAQLVLLAALGGYALTDFLFLTEYRMVGAIPILPFAASGLIATALALPLGRGAPVTERLGVAVLVVAAALAATYPGLMRHALESTPQPDTLVYEARETALFQHPDAPELDFRGRNLDEFWSQVAPGEEYSFRIHSADTGAQVLDLRPVHAQTRMFYQTRDAD
ncbi:hypothetical protein CK501_05795 [Halovibrio salipaludis]|uniref:Uncharacterized protein n=1 Tax=Halovibrio salipaludis TaxID=2032626 RepID=A0A2A2F8N2_9GAMM|nr:hypothetical protein [Halovibrio salipaludis]PAU81074.1 hypothetical protein CK501_05795 [Halovibrio salipaludis]